jgi:hypothetical protein
MVTAYVKWDSTHRAALQALVSANGWKFTQEQNDYPDATNNLNAQGFNTTIEWNTSFPNPVHDLDDDDGDRRWEEAEVTADNSSFPTVDTIYFFRQEFSRWYCGSYYGVCLTWVWDGGAGQIVHLSQMSYWFLEWQTADYTTNYASYSYTTQSPPAGAASTDDPPMDTGSTGEVFIVHIDDLTASVDSRGNEADIRVSAPTMRDLDAYRDGNAARAEQVFQAPGPYSIVVTFNRPLGATEMEAVARIPGVVFGDAEAIGYLSDGTIETAGGYAGQPAELIRSLLEDGATPEGIVAFEASVATRQAYDALIALDSVYLVDVSPALVEQRVRAASGFRLGGDRLDVIVNDLYWLRAGLLQ